MNQAENYVTISGILSEIDIEPSSFIKNGQKQDSIGGTIKIKVEQPINGVNTVLEIPVSMFASKYKNDGNPNPAYDSIARIKQDYVSIAAAPNGEAGADWVRVTGARINMNEFYNRSGQLVSYPRIQASFLNHAKREETKSEATFSIQMTVISKNPEIDKEGNETGRYIIKGAVPQYGNKVDVMEFICMNPNVIDAVSQYWNERDTVSAKGRLNFSSRSETVIQEVDFGEPIERTRTINVSEMIITGGSQTPAEGEYAFDPDEIQQGLVERKARLEASKDTNKKVEKTKKAFESASQSFDLGF